MYIQEIIMEGFKSYATRTVISGWDAEFNAITGLNGSGKSNILDAICFVLGIENLRQVRATTLQDLVYKRGQAGITKASVTIVFNNEDASRSPVGFAEHKQITVTRQIVVGGKNKYLVNGHNAPPKVVENLFQSVQLNINNPHFLIMQGQITKVLNMKPPEILSMLEETAGTRMFEDRKLKALQTMTKKEKKVEEIEALLGEMIAPKLEALRKEKADFVEFKRTEAEVEKLAKFLAAFDYYSCGQVKAKTEADLTSVKEEMAGIEAEMKESKSELETIQDQIMVVTRRKEKESKQAYKIRELENALKESETDLVKLQTQTDFAKEQLTEEETELDQLRKQLKESESQFKKTESSFEKSSDEINKKEAVFAALKQKTEQDEELLRSLSTGISSNGQAATGYERLVEEVQNRINDAQIRVQQSELKMKSLEESVAGMKEEVASAKKNSSGGAKKIDLLRGEIESLGKEKESVKFDLEEEKGLETERKRLEKELFSLKDRLDQLRGFVSSVGFSYTDPSPNFDRSKVKGVVAELVQLPSQDSARYANALEIAAGGKLYNVVVEDERVANALLERGKLTRRVTIIPLNKIVPRPIPDDKARLAHQLTDGKAVVGLSLVTCAEDVLPAIKFVFGQSFICENKEAASKVAFDSRLGTKAVTLEGDVYEPSGTLSGGSAPNSGSILTKLCEYNQLKMSQNHLSAQIDEIKASLEKVRAARRKAADLEQRAELKTHELQLLERQLSQNEAGRLLLQYEGMLSELGQLNGVISESLEAKKAAEAELSRVKKEMSEFASNRDGKLKALEKEVSAGKKALAKETKAFEALQATFIKSQTDLDVLRQRIQELSGQIDEKLALIESQQDALGRLQSDFFALQSKATGLRVQWETEMQHLRQFDEELRQLTMRQQQLSEFVEQGQLDHQKLSAQQSSLMEAVQKHGRQLQTLLQQHPWIRDQQAAFGQAEGSFNFANVDVVEARRKLILLQEQHSKLRKNINFNVMDMIDRIEAKEVALKQMLSTVKRDRKKIEETITKLNEYKLEALDKTYRKVNEDFGLIFADLLPGSFARLDPPEGQPITEGLEIRVQLGGVWKASLTELSGGQRSVIALSLILSLLQFKPAPMYILDEVDAALDLSHTENIGRLFQSRFKGSQFIVVSLKEGMFSNANVLFKTRFRDGISSVERTESRPSKSTSGLKAAKRHGIALPKKTSAMAVQ